MKPIFKKFNDLKVEDINFDFQTHTSQTDGFCSAEEMISQAIHMKLKAIAITEHVSKNSDWFDDFKKKMDALKKNKNIKVFFGIEAKVINQKGGIDATSHMIANCDMVIGVAHRYPNPDRTGFLSFDQIKNLSHQKVASMEFKLLMALLDNKNIDVLGHPFGVYTKFFSKIPENYVRELLVKSLNNKIAIEINTKYVIEKKLFFPLLREVNPYVSIGSDAHHKEDIARSFDTIKKEIKR